MNFSVMPMTRKQLHDIIKSSQHRQLDMKLQDLEKKVVEVTQCPSDSIEELHNIIKVFKTVYKRKWLACNYMESRFLERHSEWLNEVISLPAAEPKPKSAGRPSKEFGESSERSKRRKTMELRNYVPVDELTYAAQMSQRAAGNADAAAVIRETLKSPTRATKFRKAAAIGSQTTTTIKKHSPEGALIIFVEANMTYAQYEVIHQANKDVYPCYTYVQRAKQACYPPRSVTETVAEVKLQDLVNHTTARLCKYLEPVLQQLEVGSIKELVLIYKWGCDGSHQSQYKQKFEEDGNSDANIFLSSLVPLRLSHGDKIIWQNPLPSSPRFCRPIKIRFVKEDNDVTNEEIAYIEQQAQELVMTSVSEHINVKHVLLPTMVDGKVCNAATKTASTLRCYICRKTSTTFNDLDTSFPENPETFKFGLSILHARIRFFEFLLHLSYKIKANVKKGRVSEKSDKDSIANAKKSIQTGFEKKLNLLVDIPKAGFGNTNDGNTSRRFFSNAEETCEITGLDLGLVQKFRTILEVLSSGFKIETGEFSVFTMETARYYVNLYPWQPMSPTVHKILIHSASVIDHALLPIGQLSEEAAEARNKHFRQFRESFTRKFSRKQCNEDILNRLLLTSDPYISSLRKQRKINKQSFSQEALKFLICEEEFSCES